MELKFTIDTDDIYQGDYDRSPTLFEDLLSEQLSRAIIADAQAKIKCDKFEKFSTLTSENIVNEIKIKLADFLSEEIALTDKWGKPYFIGSIEDLLKTKIDEVLLRAVDSRGDTIKGCTTQGAKTWVEWKVENMIDNTFKNHIESAQKSINYDIKRSVEESLEKYTKDIINQSVGSALSKILNKG